MTIGIVTMLVDLWGGAYIAHMVPKWADAPLFITGLLVFMGGFITFFAGLTEP